MNVNNNASAVITSTPESVTSVGCGGVTIEHIEKCANSFETSLTTRLGLLTVGGAVTGAILSGPCGLSAALGGMTGSCAAAKYGALGGALGGSLRAVCHPVIKRAKEILPSVMHDAGRSASEIAKGAVVNCSHVIERAVECATQRAEIPVIVQPKSIHIQDNQDLAVPYRIRRIVKNRDTDSHPVVTSDTEPYLFEASSDKSDDAHCN